LKENREGFIFPNQKRFHMFGSSMKNITIDDDKLEELVEAAVLDIFKNKRELLIDLIGDILLELDFVNHKKNLNRKRLQSKDSQPHFRIIFISE
jgi:hypothetical protein